MSVAFRRDSDEEHLEPRFELPIPRGPNPVTPRGLVGIEERVSTLEAERRDADDDETTKRLARDLRYWRARLATAELAPIANGHQVSFGSRVRFLHTGRSRTLDIVGHDEADLARDRIAFSAPLARALIGSTAGEAIPFAGQEDALEIVAVQAIPADENSYQGNRDQFPTA